jgi:hypothetical protein
MKHFDDALVTLAELGADVVDNVRYPEWHLGFTKEHKEIWKVAFHMDLRKSKSQNRSFFFITDTSTDMKTWFSSFEQPPSGMRTLPDLMNFTREEKDERYDDWGVSEWERVEEAFKKSNRTDDTSVARSRELRTRAALQIPALLDETSCDILVVPCWTETTASYGGCPQIAVPMPAYPADWPIKSKPTGIKTRGPGVP